MLWDNFIIHTALGVLRMLVKNPAKATELKTVLLEIRDTINELYPS